MQALVIDDSRAVRMLIGAALREQGFEVLEAGDGQEGLARLRQSPDVKLALVDWNMPVMDGLEFIVTVRKSAAWNDLRIVMVTTETECEQVERAMAAGANEYIMKPFTSDVLVAKLSLLGAFEEMD
jgi:two-component system, chemotaxis family, chemotaxis protein CheY